MPVCRCSGIKSEFMKRDDVALLSSLVLVASQEIGALKSAARMAEIRLGAAAGPAHRPELPPARPLNPLVWTGGDTAVATTSWRAKARHPRLLPIQALQGVDGGPTAAPTRGMASRAQSLS